MKNRSISIASAFYGILIVLLITLMSNCFLLIKSNYLLLVPLISGFMLANIFTAFPKHNFSGMRLKICCHGGVCLKYFLISTAFSVIYHIILAFYLFPSHWVTWLISAVICILAESILFWNGIISVYCTSYQLGMKIRIKGILFGLIPLLNLSALKQITKTALAEVSFESKKAQINKERADLHICRTKYPVLLVHGVFFRDFKYLNYWGRIPDELKQNGAEIYYGNHQSAASVPDSAVELAARIKQIVADSGCGKVNIIAHSKGGLDCRYAVCCGDAAPYVASITTINTPHRGCEFADYLLGKIPDSAQQTVAKAYNSALRKLGDANPDFMKSVNDLTAERCHELNEMMSDPDDIFCQSVGSKLNHATNGKFPLNFTYHLVKYFDGPNDGLVSEKSFSWGEKYTFLTVNGKRGISHGDMIDLNRENIEGFDVREFYVQLVSDLRQRGL